MPQPRPRHAAEQPPGLGPQHLENCSDDRLYAARRRITDILITRRRTAAIDIVRHQLPMNGLPTTNLFRVLISTSQPEHIVLHYADQPASTIVLDSLTGCRMSSLLDELAQLDTLHTAGRLVLSAAPTQAHVRLPCAICDGTKCGASDRLPDKQCAACEVHLHREHRLTAVACTAFMPF